MVARRLTAGAALLIAALAMAACDSAPVDPGFSFVPMATASYFGSPPASFDLASFGPGSSDATPDTVIPPTSWEDFVFHSSDMSSLAHTLGAIANDGHDMVKLDADGAQLGYLAGLELDWLADNRPEACWAQVHALWGTGMTAYASAADTLQQAYDQDDPTQIDGAKARITDGQASIKAALDEGARVACG